MKLGRTDEEKRSLALCSSNRGLTGEDHQRNDATNISNQSRRRRKRCLWNFTVAARYQALCHLRGKSRMRHDRSAPAGIKKSLLQLAEFRTASYYHESDDTGSIFLLRVCGPDSTRGASFIADTSWLDLFIIFLISF